MHWELGIPMIHTTSKLIFPSYSHPRSLDRLSKGLQCFSLRVGQRAGSDSPFFVGKAASLFFVGRDWLLAGIFITLCHEVEQLTKARTSRNKHNVVDKKVFFYGIIGEEGHWAEGLKFCF